MYNVHSVDCLTVYSDLVSRHMLQILLFTKCKLFIIDRWSLEAYLIVVCAYGIVGMVS